MKTLKTWKMVFLAIGVLFAILLIVNWFTPAESTSMEMIAVRPFYFAGALVFFVAAAIMDIVKVAINEKGSN